MSSTKTTVSTAIPQRLLDLPELAVLVRAISGFRVQWADDAKGTVRASVRSLRGERTWQVCAVFRGVPLDAGKIVFEFDNAGVESRVILTEEMVPSAKGHAKFV